MRTRAKKNTAIVCAAGAALAAAAGLRTAWSHTEGHEVPGGASLDLRYPRHLSREAREALGIQTAPIAKRTIEEVVRLTGSVCAKPGLHARISAPVAGRVAEVKVLPGARVQGPRAAGEAPSPGDAIVLLDSLEAGRLQQSLIADGRRLREAKRHWDEAETVSRKLALSGLAALHGQYRAARDASRFAGESWALAEGGVEVLARKEILRARMGQGTAAAQLVSLEEQLAAAGLAADVLARLESEGVAAGVPRLLAEGAVQWSDLAALGRPLEVLEREHEHVSLAAEADRLAGELRLLGLEEAAIQALAAGSAGPQPLALRSPISGVVTRLDAGPGQGVAAGEAIAEVMDLSRVWVEADVPEGTLARVRARETALARVRPLGSPETVLEGTVVAVAPAVDPETRTARAAIEIENPGERLHAGAFVEAWIVLRQAKEALSVPKEAVVRQGPLAFVWIATSEGEAAEYEKRDVVLGASDDRHAEIVKGDLSPLHTVVTRGAHQLTLVPAVSQPAK